MYRNACCDAPAQVGCGCIGELTQIAADLEEKKQPVKKINIASGEDAMFVEEELDYA